MVVPKTSVPLLQPAADLSLIRPCDHTGRLSGAAMPWPPQILRWAVTSGTPEAESPRLVTTRRRVLAKSHGPGLQPGVAQEPVHEPGRPADAGPVVVPQC
jgi:hypothetical protein